MDLIAWLIIVLETNWPVRESKREHRALTLIVTHMNRDRLFFQHNTIVPKI